MAFDIDPELSLVSSAALALVLIAACLHASWNLWLKHANLPAFGFTWCSSVAVVLIWSPLALGVYWDDIVALNTAQWVAVTASGVIHVGYFMSLQRGYASADLSIVYPVARGVGPMLAALSAMAFLGETPTPGSLAGLLLIVSGTFTIAGGWALLREGWTPRVRSGLGWGVLTGLFIAAYTFNDGRAVKVLAVAPLLVDWLGNLVRSVILLPMVAMRRDQVLLTARQGWKPIVGIAVLSPLAYILVLQAMTLAPISHVAPAREVSMLIAAFLGVHLLGEGDLRRRLAGAALIALGVACLVLA